MGPLKLSQSHFLVHLIYLPEMLQRLNKQYQTKDQAYLQDGLDERRRRQQADTWSTEKSVNVVKATAIRINVADCCKDPMAFKNLEHSQQARGIHYELMIICRKQLFCLVIMSLSKSLNRLIYMRISLA